MYTWLLQTAQKSNHPNYHWVIDNDWILEPELVSINNQIQLHRAKRNSTQLDKLHYR